MKPTSSPHQQVAPALPWHRTPEGATVLAGLSGWAFILAVAIVDVATASVPMGLLGAGTLIFAASLAWAGLVTLRFSREGSALAPPVKARHARCG